MSPDTSPDPYWMSMGKPESTKEEEDLGSNVCLTVSHPVMQSEPASLGILSMLV